MIVEQYDAETIDSCNGCRAQNYEEGTDTFTANLQVFILSRNLGPNQAARAVVALTLCPKCRADLATGVAGEGS